MTSKQFVKAIYPNAKLMTFSDYEYNNNYYISANESTEVDNDLSLVFIESCRAWQDAAARIKIEMLKN